MTLFKRIKLSELHSHPWQVNIPNITGADWVEFLADIKERGVQDAVSETYTIDVN